MIINPETFQEIVLDKQKHDYSNETIKFDNKSVETVSSVRLLGIQLDDKLNFSLYVLIMSRTRFRVNPYSIIA